jgi:hypothetical protein
VLCGSWPGLQLVVGGPVAQAAVEDADQAVGQGLQGLQGLLMGGPGGS